MAEVQEVRRKSIVGVVSYTIRTAALQLIGFIATLLLSYYLSPDEFGIYYTVIAMISFFTFLSDIGLAAALIQKKEEPTVQDLRTTFTVQQVLAIVIVVIIVALTPYWQAAQGLQKEGLFLLYALAFSFVLASLKTIPSILLERKLEFGKLVLPQVFENIVFYVTAVIFAARGYGVTGFTIAVLLRSIIGVIVIYILQRWPMGISFSKQAFKGLLQFGVRFQLNDLLARIKDDLFIDVLARFLPSAQIGFLGWAKRWSLFPYQLSVNSVMSVTFPTFSRLQEHPENLKRAVEKSLFFIALIIFPILAGVSVMAYPVTVLVQEYQKWRPALVSLHFFNLNIVFAAVFNPLIQTLNATGKIQKTLNIMVVLTIATWVLTPLFIYWMGYSGVAVAAAAVAAFSGYSLIYIRKLVQIQFFEQIWRQLLATFIMMLTLFYFQDFWGRSFAMLVAGIGIGAVIYIVGVLALGFNKTKFEILSLFRK